MYLDNLPSSAIASHTDYLIYEVKGKLNSSIISAILQSPCLHPYLLVLNT